MSLGFGATLGAATTDKVTTSLAYNATLRSYSIWEYRNGNGGANKGRFWDQTQDAFYNNTDGAASYFERVWSTTFGQWTVAQQATGAWHHYVITYDGTSTANVPIVYLDGVSVTVTTLQAPVGTLSTATDAYILGNRADGLRNFDGMLSQFAVWDCILTQTEARQLFLGVSPAAIRPDFLREFVPMFNNGMSMKRAPGTVTGCKFRAPVAGKSIYQPPTRKPQWYLQNAAGGGGATAAAVFDRSRVLDGMTFSGGSIIA